MSDLYIELLYTPDRRIDHPDGAWSSIAQPPDDDGSWILWDTLPDRKSGWMRIWGKRGRGHFVHVDGGHA